MTDEKDEDTRARLRDILTEIAHKHDVTVLAARDIGSHAWDLAGPDSDYDVGFLYARNHSRTRRLHSPRSSMPTPSDSVVARCSDTHADRAQTAGSGRCCRWRHSRP